MSSLEPKVRLARHHVQHTVRAPVGLVSASNPRSSAPTRQQKDPKSFKSMDEAREFLHKGASSWSISAVLNWLSEASGSFGKPADNAGPLSLGSLYRRLLNINPLAPTRKRNDPGEREQLVPAAQRNLLRARAEASDLRPLLALSTDSVYKMALRWPQVLDLPALEVVSRVVALKALLPPCDLSIMLERQPRDFLAAPRSSVEAQVASSVAQLSQQLPGADLAGMMEHDPGLLFLDLKSGLTRLRELWPAEMVDAEALAASDPVELSLAVRALCDKVPEAY